MKRILALVLALALVLTSMQMVFVSAEETTESTAVAVSVVADESWTEATYDPTTGYLTDVTGGGYYFKATFDTSKKTFKLSGVTDYQVTQPKVVIPYKITYSGIEYTFGSTASYCLTGGKASTTVFGVTELIISEGITIVNSSAFRSVKGLATVKLPSTMKVLDGNCFASSSISTINLPEGITTLGGGALQATNITSVTVPSTVTSFGGSQFYGCSKLVEYNFLFPYTALPGSTFRGCSSLKSYTFPEGVDTVGTLAFSGSGITELTFPETITVIPNQVAAVDKSLATVTFEGEVTTINSEAFKNCTGLRTMNFEGKNAPTIASTNVFTGVKNLVVNYPADGVGYDSAEWQAFFPTGTTFVRAQGEPMVEDLVLSGRNIILTKLTTSYTYFDPMSRPESGSIAVWEGCEEADFESSDVFFLKQEECSATNPPSYDIQETDDGKYIRVTITPKNADTSLNVGAPVSAQLAEKVRFPQTVPIVKLTAPSDGYVVNCNSAVNMSATAEYDSTTLTKMEFYANDVKVAEDTTEPYEATWTPTEMGTYSIYAKAHNALEEEGVSETVSVTVLSEDAEIDAYITTTFTTPVAGSRMLSGTAIDFTGTVVESSGSEITSLELFANGKSIGEATLTATEATEEVPVPPYNFALSATLSAGTYEITAVAKSADGKVGNSVAFNIEVSAMTFTKMISDNMVLQRNKPVKLSGYGVDGTTVTAQILDKSATATVSGGKWQVVLPAMPTTKSTTLTFTSSDGTSKTFNNVAIGEVLIISGQSNVTMSIGNNYSFASSNPFDGIRMFKTGSGSASSPEYDTASGTWNTSTTTTIKNFTGVGYFTGYYYYLSQNGEVPVGLIQSAVSGTGISLWVPNYAFDNDPDLKAIDKSKTHYNYMIAPWTNYTIGHVVWYQGESDSQHSRFYEKSLTRYVQTYRDEFDQDVNFIMVSLPVYDAVVGYGSHLRNFWIVREGQINISKHMDDVETAITIDSGSIKTVHPGSKDKVGQKTGLILEHFASPSADLVWKSPNYDYHEIVGDKMVIHFNDVGAGLTTKDGLAPTAFKVAGDDMKFVDATATLVGNTIEVDISGVTGTPSVRYACEDVPGRVDDTWNVNLVNSAGLPMAPFRTDDAKIQFKSYDETNGYSDPLNFVPMVKDITASDIVNGTSTVTVDVHGFDDDVASVELFVDGTSVGQAVQSEENEDTWTFDWTGATSGEHTFYAIATDVLGDVSTKTSATFSERKTVTPKNYVIDLATKKTDLTVTYTAENGAVATTTLDGVLIVASYDGDTLVKAKIAKSGEKTVAIPAAEIGSATTFKAFVFESLTSLNPVTTPATATK